MQPREEGRLSGCVCGHCKGQRQWVSAQNGAEALPSLALLAPHNPVPHLRVLMARVTNPALGSPVCLREASGQTASYQLLHQGPLLASAHEACQSCLRQAGEASGRVPGAPCLQRAVGMHRFSEAMGLEAAGRSGCWGGQERTASLRVPCTAVCLKAG